MNNSVSNTTWRLLSINLILACAGCDNTNPSGNAIVQGTVTIDGVLATHGTVTFFPQPDGPVAIGQIHSDGSYSLRTGLGNPTKPDSAKIQAGDYVATVMVMGDPVEGAASAEGGPPLAGPRLTALKYADKQTSGLEFSVKPGRNVFVLKLEGAASDALSETASDSSSTRDNEISEEVKEEDQKEASSNRKSDNSKQPISEDTPKSEKASEETKSL